LEGYAAMLRRQCELGDLLRAEPAGAGWRIVNDMPLPVVCFGDARLALRACVTSYRTDADDVRALLALDDARASVARG
jgi:hypothetical protein